MIQKVFAHLKISNSEMQLHFFSFYTRSALQQSDPSNQNLIWVPKLIMDVATWRLSILKETERTENRSKTRIGNYGDYEKGLRKLEENKTNSEQLLQRFIGSKLPKEKGNNGSFPNSHPSWFCMNRIPEDDDDVLATTRVSKRKERFAKLASSVARIGCVAGISRDGTNCREDLEDTYFNDAFVEREQWMEPRPKRSVRCRRVRFADENRCDHSVEQLFGSEFNLPRMAEISFNKILAYLEPPDGDADLWLEQGSSFDTLVSLGDDSFWTRY